MFDFSCAINPASSYYEYRSFSQALIKSYGRSLTSASRNLAPLSWVAFRGKRTQTAQFINELHSMLESECLNSESNDLFRLNMPKHHEWLQLALSEISNEINADSGKNPHARLGNRFSANSETRLLDAKSLLRQIWPEAAWQVDLLVQDVVWFTGNMFWSGSAPYAFGAIFLNPQENWTIPYFVDSLLHESGHLSLMIKQTRDPLLYNPSQKTSSPLREDPRPLNGVLHATFVLQRICLGLQKYIEHSPHLPDRKDAIRLYIDYRQRLDAGVETMQKLATWTDGGRNLFADILATSQALQEECKYA